MNPIIPWLILLAPLASAIVIPTLTIKSRNLSVAISVIAVLIALAASIVVFLDPRPIIAVSFDWINFGSAFHVPIGFTFDGLSKPMLLIVTIVGSLVHIYSIGYMSDDPGKSRFFAGLSLFMFAMLGIVLANNFVMIFIFWELVGVSSYILIGHWFDIPAPPAAANKSFIMNRIGDFGFMLGILILWFSFGSINFQQLAVNIHASLTASSAHTTYLQSLSHPVLLALGTILVFCGAIGKSAQFPLHTWLPDAMEGPTPVSALIHAATMVAAGVYMLARVFFLVESSPVARDVILVIGTITAVMPALIAIQQDDIKRILAYSTLSQLGYMIAAIGVAAPHAAIFHLFTHAFFKALLFLCSGSVILAMHHEQDIWKMGAQKMKTPITFITMLIGTLALTGCPGLSGFFSKDAIIGDVFQRSPLAGWLLIIAAFFTAFYMFRLIVVVFLGKARTDEARHAHEYGFIITAPLIILAIPSVIAGYHFFANGWFHLPLPAEEHVSLILKFGPLLAFIFGVGAALALYLGRDKDPMNIPLLTNKFYFDEIYAWLIRYTQDGLAKLCDAFDRYIIDGIFVRGLSMGTWMSGFSLRFLQVGNLQAYNFLFGIGVVVLIYFIVFH